MAVHRLRNRVQHYDWGSPTAIPALLGEPPDGRPWAELWMGSHPRAPSEIETAPGALRPLRDRLAAPLGFLLKVLAVERPLSIQAHPDRRRARAGFVCENLAGIPPGAPERCYPDPEPKSEMLCALSPFRALCGLRPAARQAELIAALGLPELRALALGKEDDALAGLLAVLALPAARGRALAAAARAAASRLPPSDAGDLAWIPELADAHPGDAGILAPLFLEPVALAPGEALFLAPGVLHAYVSGTALEVMTASDNVVRGGLTSKHVALEELRAVASRRPRRPERLRAVAVEDGERRWPVACDAFALSVLALGPGSEAERRPDGRPEILLCMQGEARVTAEGRAALVLGPGRSAFVDASTPRYRLSGEAVVYRVRGSASD